MSITENFIKGWRKFNKDPSDFKIVGTNISDVSRSSGILKTLTNVAGTIGLTNAFSVIREKFNEYRSEKFVSPQELHQRAMRAFKEVDDHPFLFKYDDNDAIERDENRSREQKDMLQKIKVAADAYTVYIERSGRPVTFGDLANLKALKGHTEFARTYEGDNYNKLGSNISETFASMRDVLVLATAKRLDHDAEAMYKFEKIEKYSDCQRELAKVHAVLEAYSDYADRKGIDHRDPSEKAYKEPLGVAIQRLDFFKEYSESNSNGLTKDERLELQNNIINLKQRIQTFDPHTTVLRNYTFKREGESYIHVLDLYRDVNQNPTSEGSVELLKAMRESIDANLNYRSADAEFKNIHKDYITTDKAGIDASIIAIREIIKDLETRAAVGDLNNQSPEFKELLQEVKAQAAAVTLTTDKPAQDITNESHSHSM